MRVFCDTGMQVVGWHSYSRLTQSDAGAQLRLKVQAGIIVTVASNAGVFGQESENLACQQKWVA